MSTCKASRDKYDYFINLPLLQFPFSVKIAAITDKNEISMLQTITIVESSREG